MLVNKISEIFEISSNLWYDFPINLYSTDTRYREKTNGTAVPVSTIFKVFNVLLHTIAHYNGLLRKLAISVEKDDLQRLPQCLCEIQPGGKPGGK